MWNDFGLILGVLLVGAFAGFALLAVILAFIRGEVLADVELPDDTESRVRRLQ